MTFEGMDPAVVRQVAEGILARARELEGVVSYVDSTVEQATWVWPGPDSEAFHTAWFSQHRVALSTTADQLLAAGAWLHAQVTEQELVSGETVTAPAAAPWGDVGGVRAVDPIDDIVGAFDAIAPLTGVLGAIGTLAANSALTGRYPAAYARFLKLVDNVRLGPLGGFSPNAFRYKQALNGFGGFLKPNNALSSLGNNKWLHRLGIAGAGADLIQYGRGVFDPSLNINERINAGFNVVASGLKASKLPPVYLGGVAISSASMIGETAAEVDWSADGFKMAWNEVLRDPKGTLVDNTVDSVMKVFGRVL